MNSATFRAQFVNDSVLSASPARLLTMLYDRVVLDLDRAERAQRAGDQVEVRNQLDHAQDIISELLVTLKVEAWEGAPQLATIYKYLLTQIMSAGISRDPELIVECRNIIEPIRQAWHEAAQELVVEPPKVLDAVGPRGELGVG